MTFFPLPDEHYADPSFVSASDAANVLWVRAASWSAHHLTDGVVPAAMLPALHRDGDTAAAELTQLRVWKRVRGGFQFVDWPTTASRAYVEAKREANRTRQQRHRSSTPKQSRRDTRVSHAVTDTVTNGVSHSTHSIPFQSIQDSPRGERPEANARATNPPPPPPGQRPPTRCPQHLDVDDPPPCGRCADARRTAEAWDVDHAKAARAAIRACRLCDGDGWRWIDPTKRYLGVQSGPGSRCNHTQAPT